MNTPITSLDPTTTNPIPQEVSGVSNQLKKLLLENMAKLTQGDHGITQKLLTPLASSSCVKVTGGDAVARAPVVKFQKAFEEEILTCLQDGTFTKAIGIIHTAKPTTPLCVPEMQAPKEIMDQSMHNDNDRVQTVRDRTTTTREFIKYGHNATLYVTYPKGGLQGRTPPQQALYASICKDSNTNVGLKDSELSCEKCSAEISGASYILTGKNGEQFFFSLNGMQAIDADTDMTWTVWFGLLKDKDCASRWAEINKYLCSGGLNVSL